MRNVTYVIRQDMGWVYKRYDAMSRVYAMQSLAEADAVKATKGEHQPGDQSEVLVQKGSGQWQTVWSSAAEPPDER